MAHAAFCQPHPRSLRSRPWKKSGAAWCSTTIRCCTAAKKKLRSKNKMNVALGVGGGIAAYKAAELARALMERGFSVQVVMTAAAGEFITPLTFAALTGRKVITNLFSASSAEDTLSSAIEHIRVAQENEILVVAPATADLLAKFAHGIASDFLTTT